MNCAIFMKNFEEHYTAWIDGTMSAPEQIDFERQLEDRDAANQDRSDARRLGQLLRSALEPGSLRHGDFLNARVIESISREERAPVREGAVLFPIRRLVFGGVFCLLAAVALSFVLLPRDGGRMDEAALISQVLSAHSSDPQLYAYSFNVPSAKASVLWISGAEFIPANEPLSGGESDSAKAQAR
jgi:hypothetical protein